MSLKSMKGVLLNGHGGFDKLEYKENIPIPEIKDDEVLIKVHAAGINNTDINTRIAWYSKNNILGNSIEIGEKGINNYVYNDGSWGGEGIKFPRIQGIDACGEIVDVGKLINKSRIGDRVIVNPCMKINSNYIFFGSEVDGAFAEYTKVKNDFALKINSKFTNEELASFPCSYSTAENMLLQTNLIKGEHILITGASGGVGSASIQLAKIRNAKISVISEIEKFNDLKLLGANCTYTRDQLNDIQDNSVDVVIDLVGGNYTNQLINKLKHFGRYATAGAVSGPIANIDIRTLYLKDLSLYGCTVLRSNVFPNLISYIEKNEIQPLVKKTFSLDNIVEAQRYFLNKKFVGKIVLTTY